MIRDLARTTAVTLALVAMMISAQTARATTNRDEPVKSGLEALACIEIVPVKLNLTSLRKSLEQPTPERQGDFETVPPDRALA